MTKVITSTKKGANTPVERAINTDALDVIFNAMRRTRTVQSFGFKKPVIKKDCKKVKGVTKAVLHWQDAATDWVDTETGEFFTGYQPSEAFKKLIDNI